MFNPEEYTVSVRRETIDGDIYYVARVKELPDVKEYADNIEHAMALAYETIKVTQEMFLEDGIDFPAPEDMDSSSGMTGRLTLRMPKSLHYQVVEKAEQEGVSLNQYVVSILTAEITKRRVVDDISTSFGSYITSEISRLAVATTNAHNISPQGKQFRQSQTVEYKALLKKREINFHELVSANVVVCGEVVKRANL
ncbi:toxin-antitoxin system HicB family antitoxin [Aeromonas allosaccharophila]|uniref:toxin-antitoxin system HicB family antitoxin n=1 Tax=Aeromonas allosaccharophila TaxID=656 RepID=UPI003D1D6FCE